MRSQVADCLNPIRGIRDQQRRAGKEPVDFARKHREALRAMETKNRDVKSKRAGSAAKKKADRFTLKKFDGVKSRLHSPTKSTEASATAAAAAAAEKVS